VFAVGGQAVFVGGSVITITRNCVHRSSHQTGFVGKGSDHLQLIKFWPSCTPGKEVCGWVKISGSALLQPACSVCVSLSTLYIIVCMVVFIVCTFYTNGCNNHSSSCHFLAVAGRSFEDEKKAKMGIVECVKHTLIEPFTVLYEREGNLDGFCSFPPELDSYDRLLRGL